MGGAASATWGARCGKPARRVLRGGSGTRRGVPVPRPGPTSHTIDHDWMVRMLAERIDDGALLRLIRKWLKAGVLDTDGQVLHPVTGTPQGGTVSPVFANVFLHYVLDVWF